MTGLDEIIRRSLVSFAEDMFEGSWTGRREREAVSLYVFGHLLQQVNKDGVLHSATQIGIEFPVPQVDAETSKGISGRAGAKQQVCKDVVIWPESRMTCWDEEGRPTIAPLAILEWKFGVPEIYNPDVLWLEAFGAVHSPFVGYAVAVDSLAREFRLSCTRSEGGKSRARWVHLV